MFKKLQSLVTTWLVLTTYVLLSQNSASAVELAVYDFNGGSVLSGDLDASTTAGSWNINSLGSLTNDRVEILGDQTGAATGDGDSIADVLANNLFHSFSLNTDGSSIDFGSLDFDYSHTSQFQFQMHLFSDAVGFNEGDEIATVTPTNSGPQSIDLTSVTQLQGFNGNVEFRLYFQDGSNSATRIHQLDDVVLNSLEATLWTFDGDGSWQTASNWSSAPSLPPAGGTVLFAGAVTSDSTVTLNAPVDVGKASFNNSNSYTIASAGANALTLSGGAELETTSGSHEIEAIIAGSNGLTKTGAGDLFLSGDNTYTGTTDVQNGRLRVRNINSIDNTGGGTVNVATDGELILQGDVASSGAGFSGTIVPDITGDGTLTLSNSLTTETVTLNTAKTFAGQVNVNGGTLVVSNSSALGSGGTGDPTEATRTQVNGGGGSGQLQLTGNVNVASETLDLNDRNDANTTAHLSNLSGNNTWGGNVNLDTGGGNYIIESQAGTLTISGNVVDVDDVLDETATLRLTGAGNGVITGVVRRQ